MAACKDNQSSMFDRTIESEEIAAAIEVIPGISRGRHDEGDPEGAEDRADHRRGYDLKDGERLRCGGYIVTGKSRGGFSVPTWEKVTVGTITDLAE